MVILVRTHGMSSNCCRSMNVVVGRSVFESICPPIHNIASVLLTNRQAQTDGKTLVPTSIISPWSHCLYDRINFDSGGLGDPYWILLICYFSTIMAQSLCLRYGTRQINTQCLDLTVDGRVRSAFGGRLGDAARGVSSTGRRCLLS